MGTLPLVRMVVRAVAPLPVLAAGGIVDGAGLAAGTQLEDYEMTHSSRVNRIVDPIRPPERMSTSATFLPR